MRHDARRLAIATVLFLVLAAGTVLAAGVTDTSRIAAGPLPGSFRMAEARVGDAGTYVWNRVRVAPDGNVTVLNEHEIGGFEWLAPATTADVEGKRHDALLLHQWGWQPRDHRAPLATLPSEGWERYAEPVYAIALATDRILSYSYVSGVSADPESQRNAGHGVQRMFVGPQDGFWPSCGPDSPWSGRVVPLNESIRLFRACMGFANILAADAHLPVRAVGTQRLGEHDTILFSHEARGLHVWYAAEFPVPLRVVAAACPAPRPFSFRVPCEDDQFDVLRLVSFRRGEEPLPERSPSAPEGQPAPGWEVRPLRGGLPDEAGVEHPFPASAALEAARGHAAGREFASVLDAGYLSFLDHRESRSELATIRVWDMSAHDGERTAAVRVEQRIEAAPAEPAGSPLPGLPPLQQEPRAGSARMTTTILVESVADRGNGPRPHPDDVPARAPSVSSMWERWRAFASGEYADVPPNVWGMRAICATDARGRCLPSFERWAGVEMSESVRDTSLSRTSVLTESHSDHRGHEMILREHTYAWGPDGPAAEVRAASAGGEITLIHSLAWVAPAAPVVVRSAFAAALASLAYLVWPTLRAGAMLLFTRNATPPDALRNPQRQRLMAAVRESPGIAVPELARALRWGRSTTEHHLAMLRRVGLLRVVVEGPRRHVFPCDAPPGLAPRPAALASETARRILELHRGRPGVGAREVARELGVSPGTVSYHLARLREERLLAE